MGNLTKDQLEKEVERQLKLITEQEGTIAGLNGNLADVKAELDLKSTRIRELTASLEQADGEINYLKQLSRAALADDEPSPIDPDEALIREKMQAGMTRAQAVDVIATQRAEDATRKLKADASSAA